MQTRRPAIAEPLEPRALLASAGDLDLSFGTNGLAVHVSGYSSPHALAIQSDGKLLVAGHTGPDRTRPTDFLLLRLHPDGSLDTSFGENGVVIRDLGASTDSIRALVVDPDDNILVGGITTRPETGNDFVLARFTPDGRLDHTFGNQGIVIADFKSNDSLESITLQPDGKLLAAGTANASGWQAAEVAVARFLRNGDLDPSFDNDGKLMFSDPATRAGAIGVHPSGRIIVASTAGEGVSREIVVLALAPDGAIDVTFGNSGVTRTNHGPYASARAMAFDAEDRILIDAIAGEGGYVTRMLSDGLLDPSFGSNGTASYRGGASNPDAARRGLAVQPDGRPLVSATSMYPPIRDGTICGLGVNGPGRLTHNGKPDASFGSFGLAQSAPESMGFFTDVAIDPQGGIVSIGSDVRGRVMLLRHHDNGQPFFTLDDNGILTLRGTPADDDLELRDYSCDAFWPITVRLGSSVHHILAELHPIRGIRILGDAGNDTITLFGDDTDRKIFGDPVLPAAYGVTVLGGEGDDHIIHGILGYTKFSLDGEAGTDRLTLTTTPNATIDEHFVVKANSIQGVPTSAVAPRYITYANFEALHSQGIGAFQIASPVPTLPLTLIGTWLGIEAVPAGPLSFSAPPGRNAGLGVSAGTYHYPNPTISLGTPSFYLEAGGTLVLSGDLTLRSLTLYGGTITTTPGGHTFTIKPTSGQDLYYDSGILDLSDNHLILRHVTPPPDINTDLPRIVNLIRRARNSPLGLWQGPGITSSVARDNPLLGIAAVVNPGLTEFEGEPVGPEDILVTLTSNGDTNLDGKVNADDYFRLDSSFLAPPPFPTWRDGDFNYDGRINADDYFLIDSAFLGQGPPLTGISSSPPLLSAASAPSTTDPQTLTRAKRRPLRPAENLFTRPKRRTPRR